METKFFLNVEHTEQGSFWVAVFNDNEAKHPDCLQAIINSGYCSDRGTASLMAQELGYNFNP